MIQTKKNVDALNKRISYTLRAKISDDFALNELSTLFLLSPTDEGVVLNGGRRGTSFAPMAIMNALKRFTVSDQFQEKIGELTVSKKEEELNDFDESQIFESYEIGKGINGFLGKNIIHIGGGHDHAYPLLKALEKKYRKVVVINIDPHLDTRIDEWNHSGTPFRRFSNETTLKSFRLIQMGTHNFSNAPQNFLPLKNGTMSIIPFKRLQIETNNFTHSPRDLFENELKIESDELVVLSLDADVVESSIMEAVSAVNPMGIPGSFIEALFLHIRNLKSDLPKIFGIYEYNPLFDNLSGKGAKFLSGILYNTIV